MDLDENRPMEQFGLLQRAMVDGFDRLPSSKTDILKTAQRLTILGVVIEGLHLLLYIKLFTGVSYVQYPQYQGKHGNILSKVNGQVIGYTLIFVNETELNIFI